MAFRITKTLAVLVAAFCTGLFLLGGHLAATALIGQQQQRQLSALADVALRRSESAVSYAAASLTDLSAGRTVDCSPSLLQRARLTVYQRGSVKDIRVADHNGFVRCSAYSETLEFDREWITRDQMLPSRDPHVRLFRVNQFFGSALGVMRDVTPDQSLIAILAVSSFLFDIMPDELRDFSDVVMELNNGLSVVHSAVTPPAERQSVSFSAKSKVYPITAVIKVNRAALSRWNHEPYTPIMALAGVLGASFGILLARVLSRPLSPVEELDCAIQAQEFRPYYQPIFDIRTRATVGAEILARWQKPDGTLVPPSRFIELAEATGRIDAITWQLLGVALEELRSVIKADKLFTLSVNIAPRQLVSPGFVERLRRTVHEGGVATRQIKIELTERDGFDDLSKAAEVVQQLREYGFKVALDDVGIGHSGLSHIQRLQVNTLKIDKFFVDTIDADTPHDVVDMLVSLAASLGIDLIAEGIERESQAQALLACGITRGQGYLVSAPLPAGPFLDRFGTGAEAPKAATGAQRAA